MANVRVGDIDLSLFLPPGNWDYLYPPAEGDPQALVDFYYGKTPLQYEDPKQRLTHDRTEHPVDYVFLLNKEHRPNYLIQKKEQKIPYEIAFDDSLPDNFFELYKEKPPVTFSCPVYEVGTKNEPIKSKELIESVIRTPGRK
jgi:hypothetical protein